MHKGSPKLFTRYTESEHPTEDMSHLGGMFEGATEQLLTEDNYGITRIQLSAKVLQDITNVTKPHGDGYHGFGKGDPRWKFSYAPENLIDVSQRVKLCILPDYGKYLEIPEALPLVSNSHFMADYNRFHADELCDSTMILFPANTPTNLMRSTVLLIKKDLNLSPKKSYYPSDVDLDTCSALGLHPGDAVIIDNTAIHAPADVDRISIREKNPDKFSQINGVHLPELYLRNRV